MHLSFGLLPSWWLFEDRPLRIPGGPALSSASWHTVLHDTGFHSLLFPTQTVDLLGLAVIAAQAG